MKSYFIQLPGNEDHEDGGILCIDDDAAINVGLRVLQAVSRVRPLMRDEGSSFSVIVRRELGEPIYTATLTFSGVRL